MTTERPLSVAEREYIANHPAAALAELAEALNRPEKSLETLLTDAVGAGTAFRAVAKMAVTREGKRVGAIMTPQASQMMDTNRKNLAPVGPPPIHPSKEGTLAVCIFKPLGDA